MQALFIFGAGGHGKVVWDAARCGGTFEPIGFLDDVGAGEFLGLPIHAPEVFLNSPAARAASFIVAIGDNAVRREKVATLDTCRLSFATVIHPSAVVAADAVIGEGTQVSAGVIVNPGAHIGRHCIINTGATVDHDCRLGDFVHVAPGATLGGGVEIENGAWIGLGARIREYRKIGPDAFVAMGAVVIADVPGGIRVMGVPAGARKETE